MKKPGSIWQARKQLRRAKREQNPSGFKKAGAALRRLKRRQRGLITGSEGAS